MAGTTLLGALCGAAVTAGAIGIIRGVRGTVPRDDVPTRRLRRPRPPRAAAQRRADRVRLTAAFVVGTAAWALSGWIVAVPLVVLAVRGWPWLMAPTRADYSNIDRLEALADWTNRVADLVQIGHGIEAAIIASRDTSPTAVEGEVSELVFRLQARWLPDDALDQFADAFHDATADKVTAALKLRIRHRGPGLAPALRDFATTVREEVRQRREVEANRAASRTAVRWITFLIIALGVGMALNRSYSAPYATPGGQLALAVMAAAFIGVLLWMRHLAAFKGTPRFLVPDPRSAVNDDQPTPDTETAPR